MKKGKCERCKEVDELFAVEGDWMICQPCIWQLTNDGFWDEEVEEEV
jgi:hypothetical protein